MVDAVNGEATLDSAAEARKQVILADRLVISKTDLADAGRGRAPDAAPARAQSARGDRHRGRRRARSAAHDRTGQPGERGGFVAEADHSDGIASFVIAQDEPIEWLAFARAMETLIALRGADLLRVKGILNVAGCRGPVVVQYVQHLAHPPVELDNWPDDDRNSRVVFITRDIAERDVSALFAAVQALAKD